jgi:hypothetical protein
LRSDGLHAGEVRARAADSGGPLRDLRLVRARIDAREDLALADMVVEVDQHGRDLARDLAAHVHVEIAPSVPVAEIATRMSPRSTTAVR